MRNKKNIIIGILIAVIALMGVGYAALAQVLTINGTATVTGTWDVRITGIVLDGSEGASNTNDVAPSYTATSATFAVDLEYPGAYAEYVVYLENRGTIDARLDSITGLNVANAATPTDIIFFIDNESVENNILYSNYYLNPGETITLVVGIYWNPDSTSIPSVTTKTATINFNYIQSNPNNIL